MKLIKKYNFLSNVSLIVFSCIIIFIKHNFDKTTNITETKINRNINYRTAQKNYPSVFLVLRCIIVQNHLCTMGDILSTEI